MAFNITNAPRYAENSVDVRFSPILENNFWKDAPFIADKTFTTRHEVVAGQVMVRRLKEVPVKVKNMLSDGSSAFEFTHSDTGDDLISILIDQSLQSSEKIYEAVENARESKTGAQRFEMVVKSVSQQFQKIANAELLKEATPLPSTTASTIATVETEFLEARKQLRQTNVNPDVLLVSVNFYTKLLSLGGTKYRPYNNDEQMRTGALGNLFGHDVIENNLLEDTGVAGDTEFVFYNHLAFSILYNLDTARMIDAMSDFNGTYAQVTIMAGFKVTTPEAVVKKIVA